MAHKCKFRLVTRTSGHGIFSTISEKRTTYLFICDKCLFGTYVSKSKFWRSI